jgi:molybdopterin converting factor small subunit
VDVNCEISKSRFMDYRKGKLPMIVVKLFAGLREGREKAYEFPGDKFKNGREIGEYLDIPEEKMAIVLINGIHAELDAGIKDGDVVSIFPAVGGG